MLTKAMNELLTRIDGEAPMGKMLRENYWIPAVASAELVADGAPTRVRLMGEDFVAFRDTSGRVGILAEACPHRRVSLALGRNEENGLRCIFHGWKFDVAGKCIEAPTQIHDPERLCSRVPVRKALAEEGGGLVWAWLGDPEKASPLPNLEFMNVPEANRKISYQDLPCNWVQGVESNMDSAHVGILHRTANQNIPGSGQHLRQTSTALAPRYEIEDQPFGFRYAALRDLGDGSCYARINTYIAPWYAIICANRADLPSLMIITTPIDDENMRFWLIPYSADYPITEGEGFYFDSTTMRFPPATPSNNVEDRWGQDRELMKEGHWTGFPQHAFTEDFAIMLSQGAIADRSDEFLNNGDKAVTRVRSILLEAEHAYREGQRPQGVESDLSKVRSVGMIYDQAEDWRAAAQREMYAEAR